MTSPNIFSFATKELSQDAVICWLIAWAGAETQGNAAREELRRLGRAFVDALFAKWEGWEVELGDRISTKVLHQERGIDVLALVDRRFVLLVEDKTDTGAHSDQLARYRQLVLDGRTKFGDVAEDDVFPIYVKTGNHSLSDRHHAKHQGYAIFDRDDFLRVLEPYRGTNAILIDFRHHLERWQRETDSFHGWTAGDEEREVRGWEGVYRWIEESAPLANDDHWYWGSLTTLVGYYWGTWIEPVETSRGSRFAIWIEEDRISFRLYGSREGDPSVPGMERHKEYWADALVECGGGRLRKPRRLTATATKPMCVAEWRGWLAFDANGNLDKNGTLQNVKTAKKILRKAIKRGDR